MERNVANKKEGYTYIVTQPLFRRWKLLPDVRKMLYIA